MKKCLSLLCIGFILIGCSTKTKELHQIQQESNFSFMFFDDSCRSDIYNSSTHTLIHKPAGETKTMTISLILTDEELIRVFQKILDTNFLSLPETLEPPENGITMIQAPSSTHELHVTNGSTNHSVLWDTKIIADPLDENVKQFSELVFFVREIIRSHIEYQQLPQDQVLCA